MSEQPRDELKMSELAEYLMQHPGPVNLGGGIVAEYVGTYEYGDDDDAA